MKSCSIRNLNLEDLQSKKNIVDGRRIIDRPAFDKLNNDLKKYHQYSYGLNRQDLPYLTETKQTNNPNNTTEARLSNNRYSEFYTVNDDYYKDVQRLAETKDKWALTDEETNNLYDDELNQDPYMDDLRARLEFQKLIDKGEIKQICKIG